MLAQFVAVALLNFLGTVYLVLPTAQILRGPPSSDGKIPGCLFFVFENRTTKEEAPNEAPRRNFAIAGERFNVLRGVGGG